MKVGGVSVVLGASVDARPTVDAQEDLIVALGARLVHDHAVVLVVVGDENGVRVGCNDVGELRLEVDVAVGIGLLGGNRDAQGLRLIAEGGVDALRVVGAGEIERGNVLVPLLRGKVGHDTALLRVSHAGAEIVGAIGDDVSRRGGVTQGMLSATEACATAMVGPVRTEPTIPVTPSSWTRRL